MVLDFELTRTENDTQLLPLIETIKNGENIRVLIQFAKAYLGMFYVIDSELEPEEKVKLLANKELSEAIFQGFQVVLNRTDLPSIEEIGQAMAEQKEYQQGYVVLAGLDISTRTSNKKITDFPQVLIDSAIGFHFSNKINHVNTWFDYLLNNEKNIVAASLCRYWVAMLKNKATYLPGRDLVLGSEPDITITQYCILPVLESWPHCKAKILFQLLQTAFKYSEAENLLKVCETILTQDENLTEKTRLYWIATAYLLAPDKYFARMSDYVGRVKIKVMPLLDFIVQVMLNKNETSINLSDKQVVQLLRIIAPIFPPQQHVYGVLGGLDINSRNVMLLFYQLACSENENVITDIKSLRKARVMKIYAAVIDNLLELQMRNKNEANFSFPDFDTYIDMLVKGNCLEGRSNRFDLK